MCRESAVSEERKFYLVFHRGRTTSQRTLHSKRKASTLLYLRVIQRTSKWWTHSTLAIGLYKTGWTVTNSFIHSFCCIVVIAIYRNDLCLLHPRLCNVMLGLQSKWFSSESGRCVVCIFPAGLVGSVGSTRAGLSLLFCFIACFNSRLSPIKGCQFYHGFVMMNDE